MEAVDVSKKFSPPQAIRQGDLLVSDPSLRDSIFDKSVVLLAQHSDEGAFGLILNQPSEKTVGDFIKDGSLYSLSRLPVHVGGPVASDNITFAAFWISSKGQLQYSIRISAEDALERSKKPGVLIRAFTGYSGWTAGQLEEELEKNSWVPAPAPDNFLGMAHDESLWSDTLNELSAFHRLLALCPQHPWLN